MADVHLVPTHARTVAVAGAHCTDAHCGVVYVGDGVVAGVVHLPAQTAVSTSCSKNETKTRGLKRCVPNRSQGGTS